MTYQTSDLSSWGCMLAYAGTVWRRPSLWKVFLQLILLSFVVAVLTLLIVEDHAVLQVGRFAEISKFLRVFVGLLLGFFISSSVQRWWQCADGFLALFDAIRNLQMQLYALGVAEANIDTCIRYGVLSAWILNMQLHTEALQDKPHRESAEQAMWDELGIDPTLADGLDLTFAVLKPDEKLLLEKVHDPAGLLWMWVGSFLGHMAEEDEIPGMATPTYGRLMNLAQDAHGGIRLVRSSITVQAPYIYVQMLASLVHVNNIFNAVSFGLTSGAAVGTMLSAAGAMSHLKQPSASDAATPGQAARDGQTLIVSFFFSVFGPFVYQALLEVSIAIAQPFSNKDGEIPTWRLLQKLETDLHDGKKMARNTPWEAPMFKQPAKK